MYCEECGTKLIIIQHPKSGFLAYCPKCMPNADHIFMGGLDRYLSCFEITLCKLYDEKRLPKELEEYMSDILEKRQKLRDLVKKK